MAEILHQLIGSLSHFFQGFIHPRSQVVQDFSAINSTSPQGRRANGIPGPALGVAMSSPISFSEDVV